MDDRRAVAWLHRRAGFGLHPDALATAIEAGPADELARLTQGSDQAPADPWEGFGLDPEDGGRREAIVGWLDRLVTTSEPFVDRRSWMLHGWLVSSLAKVANPTVMVEQIRLLTAMGGGDYAELLRAITVDRAMLVYLDGRTSTAEAPNENFARELFELFSLGVGNYREADVQAAARALTGWVVTRERAEAVFVPRRHDDAPQTVLGIDGISDVDGVIDAVIAHPEHPRFVARRVVREYLGDPTDDALDGVVDELAGVYLDSERRLDAVIVAALERGLRGASTTMVLAPVPWLVMALRATGVPIGRIGREAPDRIREMGQLPLLPPDVSGWPGGTAWFSESSLIARTNLAVAIAGATAPSQPLLVAVADGDLDLVAQHLGLPEPFSPSTQRALRDEPAPTNRLALALVSPENLLS